MKKTQYKLNKFAVKIKKKRGARIGDIRNPKGNPNPNIANIRKTGALTDAGKFWQHLNWYTDDSTAKTLQKIRQCDKCPLQPIQLPNGNVKMQCPHYKQGRKKCVLPVKHFLDKCKVVREAEKLGWEKVAKLNAMKAMGLMEMRLERDLLVEGAPSLVTAEFQKIAGDQIHQVQKVSVGEKQNIVVNENVLDVNKLLDEEREKVFGKDKDLEFEDDEGEGNEKNE